MTHPLPPESGAPPPAAPDSSSPGRGVRAAARFIACGAGTGASPVAPGTVGCMLAIPLYVALSTFGTPLYLVTLAALTALGVWAADMTAADLGAHDPGSVVIDEILGYLVAMAGHPPTAPYLVGAFILFRVLDIAKWPPPIKRLERLGGGRGIVADDLMAGLYTNLALIFLVPFVMKI